MHLRLEGEGLVSLRPKNTRKLAGHIATQYDTNAAFALAVGVSESYVSHVLAGRKNLTPEAVDRWLRALNLPADQVSGLFETCASGRRRRSVMPATSGETGQSSTPSVKVRVASSQQTRGAA